MMEEEYKDAHRVCVELKTGDGVYYSGDKIGGCVTLICDKPITITGVQLRLRGGAKIHWSEHKGRFPNRTEVEHRAEETYFDETIALWGHDFRAAKAVKEELGIGRHMFPFSWLLPTDCPTSCEGPLGWVRYSAQANVFTPLECELETLLIATKHFTVIRHVDLNYEKGSNAPVREQRDMVLHTAFCRPGEVSCTLGLSRSGFVPGEVIRPDIQIHNIFPGKIKESSLTLKQTLVYGTDGHSRTLSTIVKRVQGGRIKPGKVSRWENKGILIPPLPPSRIDGCAFITTSYDLILHINLQSHSITISVPVKIGTLPHSDVNLDTWQHNPHHLSKWLNHKMKEVKCNMQSDSKTLPKYRTYNVATKSTKTLSLDLSPGVKRRSDGQLGITLDFQAQESIV